MFRSLIAAAVLLFTTAAFAIGPDPVWTLGGFAEPESVIYSTQQKILYVSNVNGAPDAKDGNGFISQVSTDGHMIKRQWFKGLNAPKGLGYYYGLLYVADIDELIEIDTGNARVKRRFKAPGAKFLNDVAVSPNGTVYVSDMFTNTIWRLFGNEFKPWVHDDALQSPNGVLVDKGQLVVASWGVMTKGFETDTPGYLTVIDPDSHAVTARFAPIPLGNLDGLASDGKGGYYVSDWMRGNVFHVGADGNPKLWLQLEPGTADLNVIPGRVLVPEMKQNSLAAYAVDKP